MRTIRIVATALIVCTALVACGGQDAGNGPAAPTPTGASPVTELPTPDPTGPVPPPSDPVDPTAPASPPPPGKTRGVPTSPPTTTGEMTLTGRIEAGVEAGCLLLDGYLLVGGARDVLSAGASVIVTGRPNATLMTTCQQGIPFEVATAKRA
ncbi:hypothetical protein [Micromonospora craniellae]|uniref:Uncharacterized protein n=1 Tax=Micromonospora craniellae TaxID=2294034 RepID=A0A372FT58_9ACTN|nr:hypothetical protein [Micromonospora craniellae]QOC93651.1 hypothetical protein ID554_08460 [Micromonospora craniellae]RFS43972.1 hypothetical protein D0Q02_24680 [Micromonospora craniellae]